MSKILTCPHNLLPVSSLTLYKYKNYDWWQAVEKGNLNVLKYMVEEQGFDINEVRGGDETALHIAVRRGDYNLIQFLLEHGANITIGNIADLTPYDYLERFVFPDNQNYELICAILEKYDLAKIVKFVREHNEYDYHVKQRDPSNYKENLIRIRLKLMGFNFRYDPNEPTIYKNLVFCITEKVPPGQGQGVPITTVLNEELIFQDCLLGGKDVFNLIDIYINQKYPLDFADLFNMSLITLQEVIDELYPIPLDKNVLISVLESFGLKVVDNTLPKLEEVSPDEIITVQELLQKLSGGRARFVTKLLERLEYWKFEVKEINVQSENLTFLVDGVSIFIDTVVQDVHHSLKLVKLGKNVKDGKKCYIFSIPHKKVKIVCYNK